VGTNYVEGGHYAEAVVSTGAEADLIERETPSVTFTEATKGRLHDWVGFDSATTFPFEPVLGHQFNIRQVNDRSSTLMPTLDQVKFEIRTNLANVATFFDFDSDGQLDLFWAMSSEQHLYHNDQGKFTDISDRSGAFAQTGQRTPIAVVAGDYDNDEKPDLLVVREGSLSLYRNLGGGRFADVLGGAGFSLFSYFLFLSAFFFFISPFILFFFLSLT